MIPAEVVALRQQIQHCIQEEHWEQLQEIVAKRDALLHRLVATLPETQLGWLPQELRFGIECEQRVASLRDACLSTRRQQRAACDAYRQVHVI